MAPVIAKTLEAVAASLSGSALAVITSPHAICSYSDLVLSITEAAKTKSIASNNLAFSSTRIAPGIYAHLSSKSLSVKDEETFGEESVTATAVLYNLSSSTDDLQQSVRFDLAYLDTELLLKLKHIQIGYADDLAKGEITIAVWAEKDAQIHEAILALRERMNADMYQEIVARSAEEDPPVDAGLFQAEPLRNILEESILAFENRGSVYKTALHKSRELLKKPLV